MADTATRKCYVVAVAATEATYEDMAEAFDCESTAKQETKDLGLLYHVYEVTITATCIKESK